MTVRADDGQESEFRPGQPPPQGRITIRALRRPRRGSVEALRDLVADGVPPELSGLRELHLPRPAQMDPAIQELMTRLPDCQVTWVEVGGPPPPH